MSAILVSMGVGPAHFAYRLVIEQLVEASRVELAKEACVDSSSDAATEFYRLRSTANGPAEETRGACSGLLVLSAKKGAIRQWHVFSAKDRAFRDGWADYRRDRHADDTCDFCTLE